MSRVTLRKGLALMLVGTLSVTVATFLHGQVADLLLLPPWAEGQLTFYGFMLGAAAGAAGVLVTVAGLLQGRSSEPRVSLAPIIILLLGAVALFFFLTYLSFTSALPGSAPGESVTI